jgi:hypothetical protein
MEVSEDTSLSSSESKQPPSPPQLSSAKPSVPLPLPLITLSKANRPAKAPIITTAFGAEVTLDCQHIFGPAVKPKEERDTDAVYKERVRSYICRMDESGIMKWIMYISRLEDIHYLYTDPERREEVEAEFVEFVCLQEHLVGKPSFIPRRMAIARWLSEYPAAADVMRAWGLSILQLAEITVRVITDQYLLHRLSWLIDKGALEDPALYIGTEDADDDDYDTTANTISLRLIRLAARIAKRDTFRDVFIGGSGITHVSILEWVKRSDRGGFERVNQMGGQRCELEEQRHRR